MISNYVVEFIDVCKLFGQVEALRNINFKIKKGEIHALLGPNGAGKTTLLRIMCGIIRPSMGRVRILGRSSTDPALRGKIGYMPQVTAGYHNLSAWDNVKIFAELAGIGTDFFEKQAYSLFRLLRLEEKIHATFDEMSSGEQRAVSLIRSIIIGNEILLLDEPTSGLDLERARIVRNLIAKLQNMGRTIILSSHIVTDVEELAEKVLILKRGELLFKGKKNDLITRFASNEGLEKALLKAFGKQLDTSRIVM